MLHFTAPLSIESTLWFVCSSMISLAFVGHLGSQPLAACVLANSVYNISGYSLVVGMAAGMNSLSGQVGHACGHAQTIPATAAWVLRALAVAAPGQTSGTQGPANLVKLGVHRRED